MSGLGFITQGVIAKINGGISNVQDLGGMHPIVQISDFKAVGSAGINMRYRVSMTDGTDSIVALISSQLIGMIQNQEIIEHSIIKINEFSVNVNNGVR